MQAWERRLNDLWLLLERCHATYLEPELFRLNTNQFLQTSRTVTFIVQKNKDQIPGFDDWYRPITAEWGRDTVMKWAKDSRNTIEKVGDLDLHSTLTMTLFWSYITEQDISLVTGREELLQAGTKRLIRFARSHLPSGVVDSSAVRIERRWVANTLPHWELLQAFTYIYAAHYRMCQGLAAHIGDTLSLKVPSPDSLFGVRGLVMRTAYLKLSDMRVHSQSFEIVRFDRSAISPERETLLAPVKDAASSARSLDDVFDALCVMASSTFEHDGYHAPMVFMYDENLRVVDMMSVHFGDRVDKYIFWRTVADRIVVTKAKFVVMIGEMWIRDMRNFTYAEGLGKLPITGERLSVAGLDHLGVYRSRSWDVVRTSPDAKPSLELVVPDAKYIDREVSFVFAPVMRVFGIPYPPHFAEDLERTARVSRGLKNLAGST
ncbi:hypothetical protein [Stenotrophomonas sp.]|uniref:hypothetical protein n=1 Tax=Stenotrophomonas sp. TaxID=69392 RepID=UPI0028AD87F2|nr:hypothetical protein [Stenotrophomonas sp.]